MTISRSTFAVELLPHAAVLDLRSAISCCRTGTPLADIRIYFRRHNLSDLRVLCSHIVTSGSIVTLALAIIAAGLSSAYSNSNAPPATPSRYSHPHGIVPRMPDGQLLASPRGCQPLPPPERLDGQRRLHPHNADSLCEVAQSARCTVPWVSHRSASSELSHQHASPHTGLCSSVRLVSRVIP